VRNIPQTRIRVLFERIEKRIINRIQLNGGLVDTENPEISHFTLVGKRDFQGFRSQRTVMRNIFYTTNRKKKELNLRLEGEKTLNPTKGGNV
jgi:hypothetical protein